MLIVPGLAVPTGSSLYTLFIKRIGKLNEFLQNFYLLKSGDFFVILLVQHITFGILFALNQFTYLIGYYFSPTAFLLFKTKPPREQIYMKEESSTFSYGYNLSLSISVLAITFVYSLAYQNSHSPHHRPKHHLFFQPVHFPLPRIFDFV